MANHVIIGGAGRSGSNRLLDLFDCHPEVVCRSEPAGLAGGEFRAFAPDGDPPVGPADLERFASAAARARARRGAIDRQMRLDKSFFRPRLVAAAGQRLLASARARRVLVRLGLIDGVQEWTLPRLYVDQARLAETLLVLKGFKPRLILRLHDTDPQVRVVHNIRRPDAYLQSWYNRFALKRDPGAVFARQRAGLERMRPSLGIGPEDLDPDPLTAMLEAQLLQWRYRNETLFAALRASPRYTVSHYDWAEADQVGEARRLYEFVGLDWEAGAAARVGRMQNTLFARPHREALDTAIIARAVDRALAGSCLHAILGADVGAPAG